MHLLINLLLLVLLTCSGCSTLHSKTYSNASGGATAGEENQDDDRLYQLYIDANGDLLDPATHNKVNDEEAYISDILKNFNGMKAQNPSLQLTIFVHGGLNTFERATSRVDRVKDKMLADGKYPLFISWDSAGLPNYTDHLFLLRRGIKSPILGPVSSPYVLIEDISRSIARVPASTYYVLFGQNSVLSNFDSKEEAAVKESLNELESQKQFVIHKACNSGLNLKDYWSIINPLKLVTSPFVDGLGAGAWNSMLRRTDLVLRKTDGFNDDINTETAASKFMSRWQDNYNDQEVLLIGHSMGTIIANNIIAKYQGINFSHIVYMAAACKTKDLEYVISPYLKRNGKTAFYNLSLSPYLDISENYFFDVVPRGSLLMWIDQTLANINSFQDRAAGYWFNIVHSASQVFKETEVRRRVHLTQFGIKDGSPQKHGDFGDYPFWREEFWLGNPKARK